jgi:hypothetical protein
MDVQHLIEQLQDMVEHSSMFPWPGRRAINYDEFLRITEEIKNRLPEEVAQASAIMANRDRLLSEAAESAKQARDQAAIEAQQIRDQSAHEAAVRVEGAQRHAEQLVSEQDIVLVAQARAEEILAHAEGEAERVRAAADQYVVTLLDRMETFMARIQGSVAEAKQGYQEGRPGVLR